MNNTVAFIEKEDQLVVELLVGHSAKWTQIMLLCLMCIPVSVILIFLYQIIFNFQNWDISWFVGLILMICIVWYFLRLLLWNKGGREVLMISKNNMIHYSNYGWFTLGKTAYTYEDFSIRYWNISEENKMSENDLLDEKMNEEGSVIIGFEFKDRMIETSIDLPLKEARKTIRKIEAFMSS